MKRSHREGGFNFLFKKFPLIDFQSGSKLGDRIERQVLLSAFYLLVVPIIEPELGHLFLGQSALFPQALDIARDPPQQPIVSRITHVFSVAGTTLKNTYL